MKKISLFIFTAIIWIMLVGCNNTNNSQSKTSKKNEEEPIGYKIEHIVLSKGYQSIEPNVEITKKNNDNTVLVSLGLVECSGVTIDKITKVDNEVNIYINRLLEEDKIQLSIPQILLSFDKNVSEKLDTLKFNIINENYTPINIAVGKTQILNKIYSQFKISPNTIPDVNLLRYKDDYIWSITFNSIFDKENSKLPLVNLKVKANADTGEIISSEKNVISDYIDDGIVVDYSQNRYLLYKQEVLIDKRKYEILWLYNIKTKEKEKIFSTTNLIYDAKFSPDYKNLSLIENHNENSSIYLININDKSSKNITPSGQYHIWLMKWADKNHLYFVNNSSEKSSLFSKYTSNVGKTEGLFSINKNVSSFDFNGEYFVFTEFDDKDLNKNIYITKEGSDLKKIDEGFNINFAGKEDVLYLKNIQKNDNNILCSYTLNKDSKIVENHLDIKNYLLINDNDLVLITRNTYNNDYTLVKLDMDNYSETSIAKIVGDNLFYDSNQNTGYLNLSPSINEAKRNIIYSINFNKSNIGLN